MQRDQTYPRPVKIASLKNFHAVWKLSRDSRGEGGAAGIDRISPKKFRENLESNFLQARTLLVRGDYKFSKLRPYPIPKDNGNYRIICIPTVRDRVVQRLILKHLTSPKDMLGVVNGIGYGGAKGTDQGTHAATDKVVKLRQEHPWVLKTDISAFFDNIPREHLLKTIKRKLRRHSLVPLLEKVINCEIDERNPEVREIIRTNGITITRGRGLRQGMPLSPLLANLVLCNFDKALAKLDMKVIRYVDDLIILGNSEQECLRATKTVENELRKLELEIPELGVVNSKTEIKKPDEAVIFLGLEVYRLNNGKYAKRIPNASVKEAYGKVEMLGSYKHYITNGRKTMASALSWMENVQGGYKAAYKGATNLDSFLAEIQKRIETAKRALIEDIFGKEAVERLDDDKLKFIGLI